MDLLSFTKPSYVTFAGTVFHPPLPPAFLLVGWELAHDFPCEVDRLGFLILILQGRTFRPREVNPGTMRSPGS